MSNKQGHHGAKSGAASEASVAALGPLGYTISEAAEMLRLTRWSVYRLCDEGKLVGVYQGRRRYVTRDSLTAYWDSLPTTPESA